MGLCHGACPRTAQDWRDGCHDARKATHEPRDVDRFRFERRSDAAWTGLAVEGTDGRPGWDLGEVHGPQRPRRPGLGARTARAGNSPADISNASPAAERLGIRLNLPPDRGL